MFHFLVFDARNIAVSMPRSSPRQATPQASLNRVSRLNTEGKKSAHPYVFLARLNQMKHKYADQKLEVFCLMS